jgi:uncharacterized protein
MSGPEDLDFAGTVIDSLGFAAESGCVSGRVALTLLPRLSDLLKRQEGWLECQVSGYRETGAGGQLQSWLRLRVTGRLGLECQRCLGEMDFDCAIDSRLLLVPEGAAWPEDELESEDYDALPASRALSLLTLVEEEVLLALPIVPRHPMECLVPDEAGLVEKGNRASPFAALASLKKH